MIQLSRKPLGQTPLDSVVRAIMRKEGALDATSVNQHIFRKCGRYNAGHLIFTSWTEERGAEKITLIMPDGKPRDWSSWATLEESQSAIKALLAQYVENDATVTIKGGIFKFAPPNENDSAKYAADIALWTGLNPDAPLASVIPAVHDWIQEPAKPQPAPTLEQRLARGIAATLGKLLRMKRGQRQR